MKVQLMGDRTLKEGTMTATVVIPQEYEADYFTIKQAVRAGKDIGLIIIEDNQPDNGDPLISLISQGIERAKKEAYEKGLADAMPLLAQEKGEQK